MNEKKLRPIIKTKTWLRDQRGFTLVEMMIGASIGVITMLGLSTMMHTQNKSMQRVSDKYENFGTTQVINSALGNANACECFINTPGLNLQKSATNNLNSLNLRAWDAIAGACSGDSYTVATVGQGMNMGASQLLVSHIQVAVDANALGPVPAVNAASFGGANHVAGELLKARVEIGFDWNRLPAAFKPANAVPPRSQAPIVTEFSYVRSNDGTLSCDDGERYVDQMIVTHDAFVRRQQAVSDAAQLYLKASYAGVEPISQEVLAGNPFVPYPKTVLAGGALQMRSLAGGFPVTVPPVAPVASTAHVMDVAADLANLQAMLNNGDNDYSLKNGQYNFLNDTVVALPSGPNHWAGGDLIALGHDQTWASRGNELYNLRDPVPWIRQNYETLTQTRATGYEAEVEAQRASSVVNTQQTRTNQRTIATATRDTQLGRVTTQASNSVGNTDNIRSAAVAGVTAAGNAAVSDATNHRGQAWNAYIQSGSEPDDMNRAWGDFTTKWGLSDPYP